MLIEGEATLGTVTDVFEYSSDGRLMSVDGPGVMIKAAPFGLLFVPFAVFERYPVSFVGRREG